MDLNLAEKMAFVKMIDSVIQADGEVHPGEIDALNTLKLRIGFNSEFMEDARGIDSDSALVTLNAMVYEKKKALAVILDEVAISDGFVHNKEMALILDVFTNIGLGNELE